MKDYYKHLIYNQIFFLFIQSIFLGFLPHQHQSFWFPWWYLWKDLLIVWSVNLISIIETMLHREWDKLRQVRYISLDLWINFKEVDEIIRHISLLGRNWIICRRFLFSRLDLLTSLSFLCRKLLYILVIMIKP